MMLTKTRELLSIKINLMTATTYLLAACVVQAIHTILPVTCNMTPVHYPRNLIYFIFYSPLLLVTFTITHTHKKNNYFCDHFPYKLIGNN